MTVKLNAFLIKGLLLTDFGDLESRLNMIQGVSATTHEEGTFFYELLGHNEALINNLITFRSSLTLIGHSMGADEVLKIIRDLANHLRTLKIHVPRIYVFDPTCWGTNGASPGTWYVPDVVQQAFNWRQGSYPGGGSIVPEGAAAAVKNTTLAIPHVGIERYGPAHDFIIKDLKGVVAAL